MVGLSFDFTSTAFQHIQESTFNNIIFLFLKNIKDFIQLTLVTREERKWHSVSAQKSFPLQYKYVQFV